MKVVAWIIVVIVVGALVGYSAYLSNEVNKLSSEVSFKVDKLDHEVSALNTTVKGYNSRLSDELHEVNDTVASNRRLLMSINSTVSNNSQHILILGSKLGNLTIMTYSNSNSISNIISVLMALNKTVLAVNESLNEYINPPYSLYQMYHNGTLLTARDIYNVFINSGLTTSRTTFIMTDLLKVAPSVNSMGNLEGFINWTGVSKKPYVFESHDCDDYAFDLYAITKTHYPLLAVGVAFSLIHAFNFVIVSDNGKPELYFIEPQTGRIFKPYNGMKIYTPITFVLI